ncbi:MAG: Leucyl aminopeptidase (aminopeptidase T)-like protein [Herbinix sp.]|jgi:hypothetical protein|nr:Leucyl aminopeptidase (aminopeptidase T)-like protein [Herbinix sp.]
MFKREIINKLVKAFELQPGQIVLLQFWGEDEDRRILHEFSNEIASVRCLPIELQHGRNSYKELFTNMEENLYKERYYNIFKEVDVVIDLCMYAPVVPAVDFPDDKRGFYREHMRNLFSALMEKEKFIQIRIPTADMAAEVMMDPKDFMWRMEAAYDIDYDQIKKKATKLIQELSICKTVEITTGDQYKLSLSLEGREWNPDTGSGDLPCGEVYIAPIEYQASGQLMVDELYLEGQLIRNVILSVEEGRIVNSNHDEFNEFLSELPENGNVISEFGIGLNDGIKDLCGYSALDEKMEGTYHIGIGKNNMFGGIVDSFSHIDLVWKGKVEYR